MKALSINFWGQTKLWWVVLVVGILLVLGGFAYWFWPAEGYEAGHGQPSFDKQFARDWLKANEGHNWTLPQEIVDKTIAKYLQAYKLLTGKDLEV